MILQREYGNIGIHPSCRPASREVHYNNSSHSIQKKETNIMRSAYFRFSITVISSEHLVIAKLEGWPDIKMRWANTIYLIVRFPFQLRWCPEYNLSISFNLEKPNRYRLTTLWLDSEHILLYFGGKHCEVSDCQSLAGWRVMLIRKSRTWLMLLKRCHQSILCDMIIMGGISTIKVIHFGNMLLSLPSVAHKTTPARAINFPYCNR